MVLPSQGSHGGKKRLVPTNVASNMLSKPTLEMSALDNVPPPWPRRKTLPEAMASIGKGMVCARLFHFAYTENERLPFFSLDHCSKNRLAPCGREQMLVTD